MVLVLRPGCGGEQRDGGCGGKVAFIALLVVIDSYGTIGLQPGARRGVPERDKKGDKGLESAAWRSARARSATGCGGAEGLDLPRRSSPAVTCSRFAIRKIEADEPWPSRRLAERLAEKLFDPPQEREAFLEAARVGARGRAYGRLDQAPVRQSERSGASPFVGRSNEYGLLIGLLAQLTTGSGHCADRGRAGHRQEPADA